MRRPCAVALAILLAGCATVPADRAERQAVVSPTALSSESPVRSPDPANALEAGVHLASRPPPELESEQAARALAAFRLSCPTLQKRTDLSGLTKGEDWREPCDAAGSVAPGAAAAFFRTTFVPVRVGDGTLFATGYYEPELAGSRTRRPGYDVPIYGKPPDLVDIELDDFSTALAGKRIRGRIADGTLVPYWDRAAIEEGALGGRGLEIAWGADPIEVFFLQIQGSGRLRLPDGGEMRIGYAGQNGHAYTAIGRLLLERGQIASGQASMQAIVAWMRDHPAEGRALMRENASYVFFRELTGPGPLGALGLPVTPRTSVAADPRFVPLGAPVVLSSDHDEVRGIWIAQDTGGAIKGANRFDTFWGAGEEARAIAGGLTARGEAWLLLPRAAVARLPDGER